MLIAYLCGAVLTAVAALVAATEFSDRRAAPPPAQTAVAIIAGALWPVVAVGVVQIIGIVLLVRWMSTAGGIRAEENTLARGQVLIGH